MDRIRGFFAFWYDFIVGDDWVLAVGVLVALAVVAVSQRRARRVNATREKAAGYSGYGRGRWHRHRRPATRNRRPVLIDIDGVRARNQERILESVDHVPRQRVARLRVPDVAECIRVAVDAAAA